MFFLNFQPFTRMHKKDVSIDMMQVFIYSDSFNLFTVFVTLTPYHM